MPYKSKKDLKDWHARNPNYMKEVWEKRNKEQKYEEAERKRAWYLKNKERIQRHQREYRERKKAEILNKIIGNV